MYIVNPIIPMSFNITYTILESEFSKIVNCGTVGELNKEIEKILKKNKLVRKDLNIMEHYEFSVSVLNK